MDNILNSLLSTALAGCANQDSQQIRESNPRTYGERSGFPEFDRARVQT